MSEEKQDPQVAFRKQFTLRGMVIGALGAIVLTMSSMYVALRLGALPWPTIFVALASMFFLKIMKGTNLNEINVTHTAMSAGAMTAGGMAFTLPAIYMLDPGAVLSLPKLLVVVLSGVVLGLIFTALIRRYFVVTQDLPYPMGQAAAETVQAGDQGGKKAVSLFGAMGLAGIFTVVRDVFAKVPNIIFSSKMMAYGSMGGIWLSPMLVSIGYIIGPVAIGMWFLGALIGDVGILISGVKLGLWEGVVAADIKASLGIGLMVGTGVGIIVKGILPKAKEIFGPMFSSGGLDNDVINLRWAPLVMVIIAGAIAFVTKMGLVASIITILGVWLASAMAAQVVGQSGINPMEVFGIIILLAAKAVTRLGDMEAIFVAAIVAIACGLAGDVMNDFKAGAILKTDPKAQWFAECIGGMIGAFVSVFLFYGFLKAYGPEAFGDPEMFVAPQAGMVAAMVGGIPHMSAFIIGLALGTILYVVDFPVMTLGLGVYLPFYLSATALIGGALKLAAMKLAPGWDQDGNGLIMASGVLGGEAVVGVVIALIQAFKAMSGGI